MPTYSHKPPEERAMKSYPKGAKLVNVDAELAALPADVHFGVTTPDLRDRILRTIAQFVAEESVRGAAATADCERFIAATHAQILKPAVVSIRRELAEMTRSAKLLAGSDDAETIAKSRSKAGDALVKAEAVLRAAVTARDEAKQEVEDLVHLAQRRAEAELVLRPQDPCIVSAWAHLQAIRPATA